MILTFFKITSVGFNCWNFSKRLFFFRYRPRALLDRVGKLLGTSLIFRHYSRIFSHYGECCVLFCDFEAWKGLNYVTSWVKTSLSLVIPILFARRTVWYKYSANCVVFSRSWFYVRLEASKKIQFFFNISDIHVLKYGIKIVFILGGCTGAVQFSKYTP